MPYIEEKSASLLSHKQYTISRPSAYPSRFSGAAQPQPQPPRPSSTPRPHQGSAMAQRTVNSPAVNAPRPFSARRRRATTDESHRYRCAIYEPNPKHNHTYKRSVSGHKRTSVEDLRENEMNPAVPTRCHFGHYPNTKGRLAPDSFAGAAKQALHIAAILSAHRTGSFAKGG